MTRTGDLVATLDLARYRCVHLVGGGGKSTLMLVAARALAELGRRTVATTTTRIRRSEAEMLGVPVVGTDIGDVIERARAALAARNPVAVARGAEGEKLRGFSPEEIDRLAGSGAADALVVEADGSAGRPLKAHEAHEPVIAPSADLAVFVVGAWCLGEPLDDRTVHRAALFARRLGCRTGEFIEPRHVAAILFHPDGWLARLPSRVDAAVAIVSRTGDDGGLAVAIADADRGRRLSRVVRLPPLSALH
jgi:probable selenium-dependent hydroxylase accessory protein YqeC